MNLTDEQRNIIENTIKNDEGIYAIRAAAGSGKSFTIFKAIDYIKEHEPNAKILYIVFNKANQEEAEFKLRKYSMWLEPVKVCTAHSFAREKYIKVRKKLEVIDRLDKNIIFDNQKKSYLNDIKYSKHAPFKWLMNKYHSSRMMIDAFCEDMMMHFEDNYKGQDKPKLCTILNKKGLEESKFGIKVDAYSVVTKNHIEVFNKIFKEHENKGLYTHGMYLKAAAYCNTLPSEEFDYVFFDEAQDASYFMLKVLEKQKVKKLFFVGDDRQSIYDFDGSNVNVFDTLMFDKTLPLSKSFRFGSSIASLANAIIGLHSNWQIESTEQEGSVDYTKCTRLYRTNAKLFKDSLELAYNATQQGVKLRLEFLKNIDENSYNDILAFLGLFYKYVKPRLYAKMSHIFEDIQMSSILSQFKKELEEDRRFYRVYNAFYDILNDDLHQILSYAKESDNFLEKYDAFIKCTKELFPQYTVTMITMHRSKGLEWDNVVIAEGVKIFIEEKNGTFRKNPKLLKELNLAYVAVTRARKSLNAELLKNDLLDLNYEAFKNVPFTIKDGNPIFYDINNIEKRIITKYDELDEELIDEASSEIHDAYLIKQ